MKAETKKPNLRRIKKEDVEANDFDLQRIKAGDEAALDKLFGLLLPRAERIAAYLANRYGLDREEVTQEAILKIYKHLDKAPDEDKRFIAWCKIVMENLAKDMSRQAQRRNNIREDIVPEISANVTEAKMVEIIALKEVIDKLPELDRSILSLQLIGHRASEIAEILGISSEEVYRHVENLSKKLWNIDKKSRRLKFKE